MFSLILVASIGLFAGFVLGFVFAIKMTIDKVKELKEELVKIAEEKAEQSMKHYNTLVGVNSELKDAREMVVRLRHIAEAYANRENMENIVLNASKNNIH